VLAVMQMVGDDDDNDDTISSNEDEVSKSWINAIDRGGLWKIKVSTYRLFVCMEEVVRQHYRTDACSCTDGTKHKMLEDVLADYSVLSSWSALDLDLEEETGKSLLRMIADL